MPIRLHILFRAERVDQAAHFVQGLSTDRPNPAQSSDAPIPMANQFGQTWPASVTNFRREGVEAQGECIGVHSRKLVTDADQSVDAYCDHENARFAWQPNSFPR